MNTLDYCPGYKVDEQVLGDPSISCIYDNGCCWVLPEGIAVQCAVVWQHSCCNWKIRSWEEHGCKALDVFIFSKLGKFFHNRLRRNKFDSIKAAGCSPRRNALRRNRGAHRLQTKTLTKTWKIGQQNSDRKSAFFVADLISNRILSPCQP